jgi:leucyl aminopeptidase (aminopeptidase T)
MTIRPEWKLLVITLAAVAGLASPARAAERPDRKAIAERIVAECAGVHDGDLVAVMGDVRDIDLVEELGLATVRHGGAPLQLLERERTGLRYFTEVPEARDGTRAGFAVQLANLPTVVLQIDSSTEPGLYKAIPASRLATVWKSFRPMGETMLRRGVRQVNIGNGLYPTASTAKILGVSLPQLEKIFWDALATDPRSIQANGAAVTTAFAGARQARLTHPNGTDLRFGVEGRPVILSDGIITPERAAKGGASAILYLPAGEAQLAPVAGTAEGKVVIDRVEWGLGPIEKLTWTFKAGKLVEYSARPGPGYDRWKALYEAAPAGRDQFAGIDLGLHPGVRSPPGKPFLSYIPAGMVSLFIGDDTSAGGTNAVSYYSLGFLPGATLELDGKAIVEKGALKVAAK